MVEEDEPFLIDTNILIYAFAATEDDVATGESASELSAKIKRAKDILSSALGGESHPHVSSQNIAEFYSVATSQVANPIETAQAAEIAGALATSKALNIIYETKESFTEISGWIQAGTSDVEAGPWIHDCRLAFTARAHGIRKILTENTSDFEDFEFIEAIDPFHADGDQAGPFTER